MRTKYSIINSVTAFINNIINFVFLFLSQTLFIKIMGLEYTGINGLFSNVLNLLNIFEFGIADAVVYFLYKCTVKNDKEQIKSILQFFKKFYYTVSIFILVIGLLFIPFVHLVVKDVSVDVNVYFVYLLFLFSTVGSYFFSYKRSLIFANQRNYVLSIIHTIMVVSINIIQLFVIYYTRNYYLYLVLKIISVVLENIIVSFKANKDYSYITDKDVKPIDKDVKNGIIGRIKALFIHKTSFAVTKGLDSMIISMFFGVKVVGLYMNYYYIVNSVYSLFSTLVFNTSASVGNLLTEDNLKKSYISFKRIQFFNLWITVFTSVCILLLTEPFIKIWVGSDFILNRFILIVLIVNYFVSMMICTFNVFKDAAGIWIEDRFIPIIETILNIIFSVICLKFFGLAGVFMGTIISTLVLWFYSYPKFVYKKIFNVCFSIYFKDLIYNLFVFVFVVGMCYVISLLFNNFIIDIFICLIFSNLIFYLINIRRFETNYYKSMAIRCVNKILNRV